MDDTPNFAATNLNNVSFSTVKLSQVTWTWDLFGNGMLRATFTEAQPQPSLRVRLLSRLFLGSIWKRL